MKCENLDVWKRACRISVETYRELKHCKDYGFKDQITRSSLSVASNIAEGIEKISDKETIRFLDIARASSAELMTHIYIGIEIGYIERDSGMNLKNETEIVAKMLSNLINKISNDYRPTTNNQRPKTKDQRLKTKD
jgi:four helix bundle protein